MARFIRVGKVSDVEPGTCMSVDADGHGVALCNVNGTLYALDNTCPHAGGPLGEGLLTGDVVECPWHGWRYNVRTGKRPENPDFAVECYEVRIVGEDVQVCIPQTE